MNRNEIKEFVYQCIKDEYGTDDLNENTKIVDTGMDSFGITTFFLSLDSKFKYFGEHIEGVDPFSKIDIKNITIKEVIDRCLLMNTK